MERSLQATPAMQTHGQTVAVGLNHEAFSSRYNISCFAPSLAWLDPKSVLSVYIFLSAFCCCNLATDIEGCWSACMGVEQYHVYGILCLGLRETNSVPVGLTEQFDCRICRPVIGVGCLSIHLSTPNPHAPYSTSDVVINLGKCVTEEISNMRLKLFAKI